MSASANLLPKRVQFVLNVTHDIWRHVFVDRSIKLVERVRHERIAYFLPTISANTNTLLPLSCLHQHHIPVIVSHACFTGKRRHTKPISALIVQVCNCVVFVASPLLPDSKMTIHNSFGMVCGRCRQFTTFHSVSLFHVTPPIESSLAIKIQVEKTQRTFNNTPIEPPTGISNGIIKQKTH
jgi:hypothetical protein